MNPDVRPFDIHQLPTPLAAVLAELDAESVPFRTVHRLIDCIEVLIKLHTVAVVSQFARRPDVSRPMQAMLAAGLRTPSLGVWWAFARDGAEAITASGDVLLLEGAEPQLRKKGRLFKACNGDNDLIAFRNSYAHGATPSDAKCLADIARFRPILQSLLESCTYLQSCRWFAVLEDGTTVEARGVAPLPIATHEGTEAGHCYLENSRSELLDLHPLLVQRTAADGRHLYFFFNDLKKNAASILEYAHAQHEKHGWMREAVLARYPIDSWSTPDVDTDRYRERIEALTESFKGRADELRRLFAFLSKDDGGFLCVWGNPGVGKSSILARATQVLGWQEERRREAYPTLEVPTGTIHTVGYFVRRSNNDRAAEVLGSIERRLEAEWPSGIPFDGRSRLTDRLAFASRSLREGERILLLIDGLDEGLDDTEFLRALPREVPKGVYVLYASRPLPAVHDELYLQLRPDTARDEMTLNGLSLEDTRAMLYEHVSKYALGADYAEQVKELSEGNPLYLTLLCQGLQDGTFRLNDIVALPRRMSEVYEQIAGRLARVPRALEVLIELAAAEGFLTPPLLAQLLGMSEQALRDGPLKTCMEVLYENELTARWDDYQLFHESLREFLRDAYPTDVQSAERSLADWCAAWRTPAGDPAHAPIERRYAMAFAVPHLAACHLRAIAAERMHEARGLEDTILSLVDDEKWRESVFRTCGNAEPLKRAILIAQDVVMRRNHDGSELPRLVRYARWLHDERHRLYEQQRDRLRAMDARSNLEEVAELAAMGSTSRDRVLLAIRGMWAAGRTAEVPPVLDEQLKGWMEDARDPVLEALWASLTGRTTFRT